jgi:hypothetical protein
MRGVGRPQNPFSAAPIKSVHQRKNRQSGRRAEKDKAMLKTFTAALLAASVIAAPVLAQGTAPTPSTPATQAAKAPEGKAAVKTVKVKKHVTKHAKHRKHVKAVKADTKPAEVVKTTPGAAKPSTTGSAAKPSTTGSAPKASTN